MKNILRKNTVDIVADIMRKTSYSCLVCHYFRFAGFSRWCGHPRHHKKIKNEYASCPDWVDMFSKEDLAFKKLPMEETLKKAREPIEQ